ncbi:polyketide cyclase [uncultured Roseivirga sp.]|uniref:polyketide cyclase n=1 Tax=uncultured Roseivirga sp. TaxID=543088 RepID=UPI0030DA536E
MKNIKFYNIWKDRSFRVSIILSFVFLTVGFAFLHFGWEVYGWALFVFFPIVLGAAIGVLPNRKTAIPGFIITFIVFLVTLIFFGLEGIVCVILCLPILAPFFFLGAIVIHLIKRFKEIKGEINLKVTIIPLFLFLIAVPIENSLSDNKKEVIEVSTEIVLPYTPNQVFDAIKSVDTLIAEKPFLMKLDLPVPHKCILEKEEVGALRICYFEGGRIIERVTEFKRGEVLRMDVIDYELTGRNWLGFEEAIYLFEPIGLDSCKMTRITTYTSELYPRAYWEPLEKIGIQQEHEFVFSNLERDLSNLNDNTTDNDF